MDRTVGISHRLPDGAFAFDELVPDLTIGMATERSYGSSTSDDSLAANPVASSDGRRAA